MGNECALCSVEPPTTLDTRTLWGVLCGEGSIGTKRAIVLGNRATPGICTSPFGRVVDLGARRIGPCGSDQLLEFGLCPPLEFGPTSGGFGTRQAVDCDTKLSVVKGGSGELTKILYFCRNFVSTTQRGPQVPSFVLITF